MRCSSAMLDVAPVTRAVLSFKAHRKPRCLPPVRLVRRSAAAAGDSVLTRPPRRMANATTRRFCSGSIPCFRGSSSPLEFDSSLRHLPNLAVVAAVAAMLLLRLRQVGEVRSGQALECHAERGSFSHSPANSLAQRDRCIPSEKLRLCREILS